MEILIKRLNEQAKLPTYGSEVDPGIDLYALGEVIIEPGASVIVSTGVAMAVPVGYVGSLWSRNNMIANETIKVTAGIVDSGYREEITVELTNTGTETKTFAAGEKIAQLLIQRVHHTLLIEANELSDPEEGTEG